MADVLVDGPNVLLEEISHLLLRKPDGLVDQTDFQPSLVVFGLIKNDSQLRRQVQFVTHASFSNLKIIRRSKLFLVPVPGSFLLSSRNPAPETRNLRLGRILKGYAKT